MTNYRAKVLTDELIGDTVILIYCTDSRIPVAELSLHDWKEIKRTVKTDMLLIKELSEL